MYLPSGAKQQVVIPNVPDALLSLGFVSPTSTVFTYASFVEYFNLSGASDYQNKMLFRGSDVNTDELNRVGRAMEITPAHSGGRQSAKGKKPLPKVIESALKNHLPESLITSTDF